MRRLAAVLVLLLGLVSAAPLSEIVIEGGDPVLNALARVNIPVEPGQDTESMDLEAVEKALLDSGYFAEADARLEGDVLKVRVVPNPRIEVVKVESQSIPESALLELLDQELAIGPGAVYNPVRVAEGADRIGRFYREQGFPFVPQVSYETEEEDGGVVLTYKVDETAPVKELVIKGATVFPVSELREYFKPLMEAGEFKWELYRSAVQQINQKYYDAGYRFSGVDTRRSVLEDARLTVYVHELVVGRVDASALGPVELEGVEVGEPLNYSRLLDEMARLSRELGVEVNLQLNDLGDGKVGIVLTPGEVRYGPIEKVRVLGATAVPPEEVEQVLRLKPGDLFSPELAQEDFVNIQKLYRERGYEISPRPDFDFKDGVYTQRVHELKIEGYRLEWDGGHTTQDFVILRELPKPGSLMAVPDIRRGISNLLRAGLLAEPPRVTTEPGSAPDRVVLVLGLKEAHTTVMAPAIAWSSLEGWSGQASLSTKNLWGRAHQASLSVSFGQNDAGDNLAFSASYSIPWLWIDYADFEEVPTSLSLSVYSRPIGNLPLNDTNDDPTGWEYTERRSGGRFSIGRPWSRELENLKVYLNLEAEWVYPKLEVNDPNKPSTPDEATARSLLPAPYQSYSIGTSATYSTVENPDFPTQGFVLTGSLAYGLNIPYGRSLSQFVPAWITYKTYTAVEDDLHQAFAVRASAGAVLGDPPASRIFFLGGNQSEISTLRGYDPMELSGRYLLGGSFEYRYDFGFKSSFSQTIIGIAFVDLGAVWNPGDSFDLKAGYGLGVQLNLGYGSILLPALRFDYGFSGAHPTGVFHFRIGPVF
jgi:outer membrane protein insertion porin family